MGLMHKCTVTFGVLIDHLGTVTQLIKPLQTVPQAKRLHFEQLELRSVEFR